MAVRIALAGNPNCGKTTLFNALTGANQYVGNWPGVTVEKKEGRLKGHKDVVVTDLPGIYSLSPYTLEEVVSRDYLTKEKPEAIINLVDGTNIERNLYLTTQILELGIPVVVALNMIDVVKKTGDRIDTKKLASELGCDVIETSALKGDGIEALIDKAIALTKKDSTPLAVKFSDNIEAAVAAVDKVIPADACPEGMRRWYAVKALENDDKVLNSLKLISDQRNEISKIREVLENEEDDDIEAVITNARYDYIVKVVKNTVKKTARTLTPSDKVDRIVTNRFLALPIFFLVMAFVYWFSISTIGTMGTDWVNDVLFGEWIQGGAQSALEAAGVSEVITSLVVDGILGGVGAVLGFVPQMACVFLCLSILEDCGYMARIAFVMDRIFRSFGLSGKSFIPMLVSSGCGIPGIQASRTIENDNDRRITIMTTTFVPCGAKLPIIALISAVIGGQWWIAPAMYFIALAGVLIAGIILKKFKSFSGDPAPFVMELPAYHFPQVKTVILHVWERVIAYIVRAGTIIFLASAAMWFLASFGFADGSFGLVDAADSLMAGIGGLFAWLFVPLGFGNWQGVASTISGLVAKENVVSTMSILANLGEEVAEAAAGEDADALGQAATAVSAWIPSAAAAFSFLVFNMMASPCLAAVGTQAKELNNRKWFWQTILFQNVFAYCAALMIYQFTMFFTGNGFTVWTAVALGVLAITLYLLCRPDPNKNKGYVAKRSVA
ncbi:MAG: ferrous iron transport protein B [Butyrivibrio sp.]|nr:ferrous iron transport protein B [Butyrivibrio sp.]